MTFFDFLFNMLATICGCQVDPKVFPFSAFLRISLYTLVCVCQVHNFPLNMLPNLKFIFGSSIGKSWEPFWTKCCSGNSTTHIILKHEILPRLCNLISLFLFACLSFLQMVQRTASILESKVVTSLPNAREKLFRNIASATVADFGSGILFFGHWHHRGYFIYLCFIVSPIQLCRTESKRSAGNVGNIQVTCQGVFVKLQSADRTTGKQHTDVCACDAGFGQYRTGFGGLNRLYLMTSMCRDVCAAHLFSCQEHMGLITAPVDPHVGCERAWDIIPVLCCNVEYVVIFIHLISAIFVLNYFRAFVCAPYSLLHFFLPTVLLFILSPVACGATGFIPDSGAGGKEGNRFMQPLQPFTQWRFNFRPKSVCQPLCVLRMHFAFFPFAVTPCTLWSS